MTIFTDILAVVFRHLDVSDDPLAEVEQLQYQYDHDNDHDGEGTVELAQLDLETVKANQLQHSVDQHHDGGLSTQRRLKCDQMVQLLNAALSASACSSPPPPDLELKIMSALKHLCVNYLINVRCGSDDSMMALRLLTLLVRLSSKVRTRIQ